MQQGFTTVQSLQQAVKPADMEEVLVKYLDNLLAEAADPETERIDDVAFKQAGNYFTALEKQEQIKRLYTLYNSALEGIIESAYPTAAFHSVAARFRDGLNSVITSIGSDVLDMTPSTLARKFTVGNHIFRTGIESFDAIFCGSFMSGYPVLFIAPRNNGKSSVAIWLTACFVREADKRGREEPNLPLMTGTVVETEVPPEEFVRSVIAALAGVRIYDVNAIFAYDVLINEESDPESVMNAISIVRTSYAKRRNAKMADMPADKLRTLFVDAHRPESTYNRLFDERQQQAVRAWDTRLDRHLTIKDSARTWTKLEEIANEALERRDCFFLLDHLQGVESSTNARSDLEIDFGYKKIYDMLRPMAFITFSQPDSESEKQMLAGKLVREVFSRGSRAVGHHARYIVPFIADRKNNTTEFMATKVQKDGNTNAFKLGYDYLTQRYEPLRVGE